MFRIAIIGLGHIGRTHVAALLKTEGLELISGCDQDANLASVLPQGVHFYSSHTSLLDAGGFDTVVVATPNRTHNTLARKVLAAGYHVIVEKPAAASLAELQALENLATAQERHIYYAFHAALAFEVDALVAHLTEAEGHYGPLTAFHCRFFDPYIDSQGRLVAHALSLDDCWSDSGVNALSVLDRFYPVNHLCASFRRQSGHPQVPPGVLSASVGFHFPINQEGSAGFGLIDTAWDQGLNYKATSLYFGQSGWRLLVDHTAQTVTAYSPEGVSEQLFQFEGDRLLNHYLGIFADYYNRVQTGSRMNASAALRVHAQLFKGYST